MRTTPGFIANEPLLWRGGFGFRHPNLQAVGIQSVWSDVMNVIAAAGQRKSWKAPVVCQLAALIAMRVCKLRAVDAWCTSERLSGDAWLKDLWCMDKDATCPCYSALLAAACTKNCNSARKQKYGPGIMFTKLASKWWLLLR